MFLATIKINVTANRSDEASIESQTEENDTNNYVLHNLPSRTGNKYTAHYHIATFVCSYKKSKYHTTSN